MDKEHIHENDIPEEAVSGSAEEAIASLESEAVSEKPELDPIDALAAQLVDHVDVPEVSDVKPEDSVEEVAEEATTAEDAVEEAVSEVSQEVSGDSAFTEETEAAEEVPEAEEAVETVSEVKETEPAEDTSEEEKSEEKEDSEPEKAEETDESEESDESEEESEEESDEDESEEDSEEDEKEDDDDEEDEEDEGAAGKSVKKKADKHSARDKEESAKERSLLYTIFDTVRYVAIGLLVGILLVVFVIQRNDVYGSSMEPTLHSGDAVFVEMISVYTGNFSRGDIVTIDAKGMEGYSHEENLIKRIVGLPGETIKIEDGNVYINGVLLDESAYLPEGTKTYVGAEGQARGYQEVTLGPDEYYCMGDNRGGSNDSRRMGPFKKKQIEAKVLMRIYPFNKMKFY